MKSLRIVPIDEDKIELYFRGFIKEDTENNSNQVKRAVASLESAQKFIAAKPAGAHHSNICIPGPAPITKEKPEFPCDILYEVPDPGYVFDPWNPRKLKIYTLTRRSRLCNQLWLVYTVTTSTLQKRLKNGLKYSRVETLPNWNNVFEKRNDI